MEPNILQGAFATSSLWLGVLLAGAVVLPFLLARLLWRQRRLAPHELQERVDAGLDVLVLDVRNEGEFARCHIADALNVPMPRLRAKLGAADGIGADAKERAVVLVCEDETLSRRAAEKLRRAGFTRVHVLDGGMRGWRADRLPVKPATAMPASRAA